MTENTDEITNIETRVVQLISQLNKSVIISFLE